MRSASSDVPESANHVLLSVKDILTPRRATAKVTELRESFCRIQQQFGTLEARFAALEGSIGSRYSNNDMVTLQKSLLGTDSGAEDEPVGIQSGTSKPSALSRLHSRVHRVSTGKRIQEDKIVREVLAELSYPLTRDKQHFYLSNCPANLLPDEGLELEENRKRMTTVCGQSMDSLTGIINHRNKTTKQCIVEVFFDSSKEAIKAKREADKFLEAKRPESGEAILTYARPDETSEDQDDFYLWHFSGSDKFALREYLQSVVGENGPTPIHVEMFTDRERLYKPDRDKGKKPTPWDHDYRVVFENGEAMRRAKHFLDTADKKDCAVSYVPDPYTLGLVICFRTGGMPKELFQKLSFHCPDERDDHEPLKKSGYLVEEFEYARITSALTGEDRDRKDQERTGIKPGYLSFVANDDDLERHAELSHQEQGDIFYDLDEWETSKQGYARLITMNWWYQVLLLTLVFSSLAVMDMYSNFVFAGSLFNTDADENLRVNTNKRYNFLISFFGLEGYLIYCCWRQAQMDLQLQMAVLGDIIKPVKLKDRVILHFAGFAFQFLQIEGIIRDIPKTLHPFTSVQEKAAVKMDGARVFVIGWESEHMYRCDNNRGRHRQLPSIILGRLLLTAFKVHKALVTETWSDLLLCLSGVLFWPIQVYTFLNIIRDRREFFDDLRARSGPLKMSADDLNMTPDQAKMRLDNQQLAIWQLYQKHFPRFAKAHRTVYSLVLDCFPGSFWAAMGIFLGLNVFILLLHHVGVLVPSRVHCTWEQGKCIASKAAPAQVTMHELHGVPLDSLESLDVDGDGIFSSADLASLVSPDSYAASSRPAATRELGLLLQRGLAATAAAKDPLPDWASSWSRYLPRAAQEAAASSGSEHPAADALRGEQISVIKT